MLFPFAFGTLTGVSVLHFFSAWPPGLFMRLTILSLAIIPFIYIFMLRRSAYRTLAWLVFSFCIGWGWAYYQVGLKMKAFSSISFSPVMSLTGKISGITHERYNRLHFFLELEGKHGWKIHCWWLNPTTVLHDGDKISLSVNIKQPWSTANPGGTDLERFYFVREIAAMGEVLALTHYEPASSHTLDQIRQRCHQSIQNQIGDKPLVGVIQAMTVGIQSNITPKEWKVFQATGTTHVVAISGSHIAWAATMVGWVVTFLVKRSYYLTSLSPAGCWGAIAAMVSAVLYSACAGWSVPTQRACILVLVAMTALLKRQVLLSWQSLALSWLGVGLISVFAPLQLGFWLSFGCVGALLLGKSHYQKGHYLRRWLLPQWVVFIGLLPFCSLFFQQIPLLSPIANMIFLPLVSIAIVPFCLLGLVGVPYAYTIAYHALCWVWPILEMIAEQSFSLWYLPKAPLWAIVLGTLGTLLLLGPRGLPGRRLGWFCLLSMLFPRLNNVPFGQFEFTLLDVGQGLSAVIRTQHHTLLFDAGPIEAGERIILPFFRTKGVASLDKIIISHGDLDHRGGLLTLHNFPFDEVITSEPLKLAMPARLCEVDDHWEWDGVEFKIMSPLKEYKKRNNLSCVLKVSIKNKSLLLTGDIETGAEQDMVRRYRGFLQSDVLVVPHHGSLTSSSEEFIEAVAPHYALFPVGKDNRYHFPKDKIKDRYEAKGIKSLLVWQTGAIIFHFDDKDELTPPIEWRDTFHHYWNKMRILGE